MRIQILYILFFYISSVQLAGQVSYGGEPYPYVKRKVVRDLISMPLFDYTWVLREMEADERTDRRKPLPVAWNYDVDLTPYNSGTWENTADGKKLWRLEISSGKAYALSVFFDEFRLKPGARIFLYDPARNNILGSFDHRSNKPSGNFPVSYIPGDMLILELQIDNADDDFGSLKIGSVSHAFADIFGKPDKKDGYFGRSQDCNIDVNCPSGDNWQDVKRAVCRVIFKRSSFLSELCTGTVVNNTARDQTPYFYTANHCIDKESSAQSAIVLFGYESPSCYGPDGTAINTIAGSTLLATEASLDFSLLLLSEEIPDSYEPYYAGWTLSTSPSPSSVCIHHPQGDVKKISSDNATLTTQPQEQNPPEWFIPDAFWRVIRWDEGATEGGSSGSPLFNRDKMIVGNLTGGDASCDFPFNDYFSMFNVNWEHFSDTTRQLKYWLDKMNTGTTALRGYDPYYYPDTSMSVMEIIEYFTELNSFRTIILNSNLEAGLSGDGYYTVFAPVESAFEELTRTTRESLFYNKSGNLPFITGYHILNEELRTSDMYDGMRVNTSIGRDLKIQKENYNILVDKAKIYVPDIVASNGIIHLIDEVLFPLNESAGQVSIFPNPASGQIWITSKDISMKGARFRMVNAEGATVKSFILEDEYFTGIRVDDLAPGIYFIRIVSPVFNVNVKQVIVNTHHP